MPVLSHIQVRLLIQAYEAGKSKLQSTPDLGMSTAEVLLNSSEVIYPETEPIPWSVLKHIQGDPNTCYQVIGGHAQPIRIYSEEFERYYSLYPTGSAPTMLVSGIPMHRIKGTDPWQDTQTKIKVIAPIGGRVLDTATGLGYTAILAARTALQVTSIEIDPAAQEVARQNPWSQELFENDKITRLIGDSTEVIEGFESEYFSRIIHDPPAFSLAGEMYSLHFYHQMYRVLKPKGRVFHYLGNPESKSGANLVRGVRQRMRRAGFQRIKVSHEAFGLVAYK